MAISSARRRGQRGRNHQDDVDPLFPCFLFRRKFSGVSALNADLAPLLTGLCVEPAGNESAGRGARRSRGNIFDPKAPAGLQALRRLIVSAFEASTRVLLPPSDRIPRPALGFDLIGWAYLLRQGDFIAPHAHPEATIVGTYYVRCPPGLSGGDTAGHLTLLDPSPASAMRSHSGLPFPTSQAIRPEEGLLVLFPSHIVHFVPPFSGEGERIAVSFDFVHKPHGDRRPLG